MEDRIFRLIAQELGVKVNQIQAAVTLLDEGNTVPFIARYRKEMTGELKDEQLRILEERLTYLRNLEQRRNEIIESIMAQEKLTPALEEQLQKAVKLQELEDLYLPYRPKKRTRALIAREAGLEPLADIMWAQEAVVDEVQAIAATFLNPEKDITTTEKALQGAMDIVAEQISDDASIRTFLREYLWRDGKIETQLCEDEELGQAYLQYKEYSESVRQMPSHRILAVNRGETMGALKVTLVAPHEKYIDMMSKRVRKGESGFRPFLEAAVADAYKRLILPALEREVRKQLTELAEEQAIHVFAKNLKSLLLQAPLSGHVIMGLDPGYRTGCKMAIIDQQGNVLDYGAYYLTMSDKQRDVARHELSKKIREYKVTLISIGNGTASYETEQFVSDMIAREGLSCHYLITNEAGASVYSASKLAIEELPDLDVSIRGAVSIARRVQDPLAEAVKIDPKSIGVGQYQHDVNQKQLSHTLDQVVETVVNHVGVELNTASPAILQRVAGINGTVAKNISVYRREHGAFKTRKELLKVNRLGPAAFMQCAGFLRIQKGDNPLDNTPIHPESYELAQQILLQIGFVPEDLTDKEKLQLLRSKLPLVDAEKLAKSLEAGLPTVKDILSAFDKPGRDPRSELPLPLTRKQVVSLEDIKVGTVVKGAVHNVVDFGAFVDFGLKTNGLLHRSELCTRKQHPADVLQVGDIIEAMVISVDAKRNRIGLSTKALCEKQKDNR